MRKSFPIILLVIFAFIGLLSSFLSWREFVLLRAGMDIGPSLCSISSFFNCVSVSKSTYSSVMGFPIASIGFAFYLSVIITAFFLFSEGKRAAVKSSVAISAVSIASILAVIFSLYLFYISKVVLHAICLYCLIMYLANAGLAITSVLLIRPYRLESIIKGFDAPWSLLRSLISDDPKNSRLFSIVGILLVGFVLLGQDIISKNIFFVSENSNVTNKQKEINIQTWQNSPYQNIPNNFNDSVLTRDYKLGSDSSTIEIVEFSDFECGACRVNYPRVEALLKKYPTDISLVNKSFPLDKECNRLVTNAMHKHSCYMAEFVRCASEQGQNKKAFDQVFTEKTVETSPTREALTLALFSWAKDEGLDTQALNECIDSHRQLPKIKDDIELGIKLDLQQTPTFFVNGRYVNSADLTEIVDYLVEKKVK